MCALIEAKDSSLLLLKMYETLNNLLVLMITHFKEPLKFKTFQFNASIESRLLRMQQDSLF
jgi:hypothetical protein